MHVIVALLVLVAVRFAVVPLYPVGNLLIRASLGCAAGGAGAGLGTELQEKNRKNRTPSTQGELAPYECGMCARMPPQVMSLQQVGVYLLMWQDTQA